MQGDIPRDTVAVNVISHALRAAVEMGVSRPVLLASLGVDEARLRHPLARLSGHVFVRLLHLINRELRDPEYIMQLATRAVPTCFSDIGYAARYAPTLEAAMRIQVRNQILRQNICGLSLDLSDRNPRLVWAVTPVDADYLSVMMEFFLGSYAKFCSQLRKSASGAVRVTFQHEPRFDREHYHLSYGCPVEFGCDVTSVEFDTHAFEASLPGARPDIVEQGVVNFNKSAQWLVEGREHMAHGYFYLSTQLNKSSLTIERMAAAFGLSERTLRRRLVDEGLAFRDLIDEVRRDMCELYRMEGARSLSEVAELLGYAELSAFTRAFRRWHGRPPSADWSIR